MKANQQLVFRSSFSVVWRWNVKFWGLIGAVATGLNYITGRPLSAALPALGATLGSGAMLAVTVSLCPVYVLPDAIRSYNFWGIYRTVTWDEIEQIRRVSYSDSGI